MAAFGMAGGEGSKAKAAKERVIILGAGGRDFHVFNTLYRENTAVVAFTAAQIPGIDERLYPPELAGPLYPEGIRVHPEAQLEQLIADLKADTCVLAYSDLSESDVMLLEARVLSSRAAFLLPNPWHTMLPSNKRVVAVTAVRTGAGKSQVSHFCSTVLAEKGLKTVLVRHPMPYGDLKEQRVQRFQTYDDLRRHHVTIEEREEYEQHLKEGVVVYAGVDYQAILEEFQGSLRGLLAKYKHIGPTIPAMGYSPEQIEDLAATLEAVDADAILIATPMDLKRLLHLTKPSTIVRYRIETREGEGDLKAIIEEFLKKAGPK